MNEPEKQKTDAERFEEAVEQIVRDAEKSALEPLTDAEKDAIRKEAIAQLAERLAQNEPGMPPGRRRPFGWAKRRKNARKRARQARRCTRHSR